MTAFIQTEPLPNFPLPVVVAFRELGHDVLTTRDAGKANDAISDEEVLRFAGGNGRAVTMHNRRDFMRLHGQSPDHEGILVCTDNPDFPALAAKGSASRPCPRTLHPRFQVPLGSEILEATPFSSPSSAIESPKNQNGHFDRSGGGPAGGAQWRNLYLCLSGVGRAEPEHVRPSAFARAG